MEQNLNKKGDGISIDINFDELVDEYCPQIIEAIIKRKRALEEIVNVQNDELPLIVTQAARKSATINIMSQTLQKKFNVSEDAATILCNTKISELCDFESKLKAINDALALLQ